MARKGDTNTGPTTNCAYGRGGAKGHMDRNGYGRRGMLPCDNESGELLFQVKVLSIQHMGGGSVGLGTEPRELR